MNKSKRIQGFVIIITFIAALSTGYYFSQKEKYELSQYGKESKGTITRIYKIRNRGKHIDYTFIVKGKEYKGSQKVDNRSLNIGDKYTVLYSENTPTFNEMRFD